jgi:hypothetical protein
MKRVDILYGLEIIMFKYKRYEYDFKMLDNLMDNKYIDWYGWFDEKEGRYLYQINATQKGLLFYNKYKHKGRYRWRSIFGMLVLLIPFVLMLIKGGIL